jgi:hypothetical protein
VLKEKTDSQGNGHFFDCRHGAVVITPAARNQDVVSSNMGAVVKVVMFAPCEKWHSETLALIDGITAIDSIHVPSVTSSEQIQRGQTRLPGDIFSFYTCIDFEGARYYDTGLTGFSVSVYGVHPPLPPFIHPISSGHQEFFFLLVFSKKMELDDMAGGYVKVA